MGLVFAGRLSGQRTLLIGFLLGHDLITVSTADSLAWISVIIQWTAMLEAPIRMFKGNDGK
jgi:hypothetical protein